MITVSKLKKTFGDHVLFEDISFSVSRNEKVGLVGRNGSGKSTILKILSGIESYDQGEITFPKNYSIGYLQQHLRFTEANIVEELVESLPKEDKDKVYLVEKILFGLGFESTDLEKSPESFSGGYQIRLNLGKLLLQSNDLIFLDEPTNYLDIVSIEWLKNFLKSYKGEFILVTHDRDFMDSVCNSIMGIDSNSFLKVKGNTFQYYDRLETDQELKVKTAKNLAIKKDKLEQFINRFKAKASKAAQARSKQKQLEKLNNINTSIAHEKNLIFNFNYEPFKAKVIGDIENISFSYPDSKQDIINNFSFHINSNDRIAIIGKNGKGKSTLLNLLAGNLNYNNGCIKYHNSARIGHFTQTNINSLLSTNTIIQEIQSVNENLSISAVRDICGTMLFEGDNAEKRISVLSGGEKSRVMLGKILAEKTNLLLLDEPTNHLDMYAIEALSSEINHYQGALVVVTHNELLLKSFAKKLIVFKNNKILLFNGTYDDFLKKHGWEEQVSESKSDLNKNYNKKDLKRKRSEIIKERSRELKPIKENIENLEYKITILEKRQSEITSELESCYLDSKRSNEIGTLSKQMSEIEIKIEELFFLLEKKSEELVQIESIYEKLLSKL